MTGTHTDTQSERKNKRASEKKGLFYSFTLLDWLEKKPKKSQDKNLSLITNVFPERKISDFI